MYNPRQSRGSKQNKKIPDDKVSDAIHDLRKQAAEENRQNTKQSVGKQTNQVCVASPVTSVSGPLKNAPVGYSNLDYVAQESDRRNLPHWPLHGRAEIAPQFEGPHESVGDQHPLPDCPGDSMAATQKHMKELNSDGRLDFLSTCSEHMSAFIIARVLRGKLHGLSGVNASVKNGLAVAVELGLPSLQTEAGRMLGNTFRSGNCAGPDNDHLWKFRFGAVTHKDKAILTVATITGRPWAIIGYGDTLPGVRDDPINDVFSQAINERNQCLAEHLAAGDVHTRSANVSGCNHPHVLKRSRELRSAQRKQADECHSAMGPVMDNVPLFIAELRAHAHDAMRPHHDRDHRSLIWFVPNLLMDYDVCDTCIAIL